MSKKVTVFGQLTLRKTTRSGVIHLSKEEKHISLRLRKKNMEKELHILNFIKVYHNLPCFLLSKGALFTNIQLKKKHSIKKT